MNYLIGTIALIGGYLLLTSATTKKASKPLLSGKKNNLLFVGDSNTFNDWSYADKIKSVLKDNVNVTKLSKWGESTNWMIKNLPEQLKKDKYDFIAVLGGSNDIYGGGITLDKTKENLLAMDKMIKDSGAKSVFITQPSKKFFKQNTSEKQAKLDELVSWMKKQDFDYLLDFYSILDRASLFKSDMRHANSDAHKILADLYIKSTGIA
jgi:hypothetical protein